MGISQSSQAVYFSFTPCPHTFFLLSKLYFLCYSLSPLLLVLYAVCSEKSPYSEVFCVCRQLLLPFLYSPLDSHKHTSFTLFSQAIFSIPCIRSPAVLVLLLLFIRRPPAVGCKGRRAWCFWCFAPFLQPCFPAPGPLLPPAEGQHWPSATSAATLQ